MTASTISFEVTEDGKVHSVVMIDQVTRVRISKLDITDQREVPGAHLEILDEKGEILESWVSGNEPHYVEKLPVGTYHLRETLAPEGYEKTEDVIFEVRDTMEIQSVFMYDRPVKETEPVPTETETQETETEPPETELPETQSSETETETKMTETTSTETETFMSETNTSETSSSTTTQETKAPKTGDPTNCTAEVCMFLLSGMTLLFVWRRNRKVRKENK